MNKKIVVLTGSFNPISRAHFSILSDAVKFTDAEKGLFIETSDPYLIRKNIVKAKNRTGFILDEETRKEMIESLNKENNKLYFGGIELGGAASQTDKTLAKIMKQYPSYDLYYLCGADKLHSIPRWHNAEHLFKSMYIMVYNRDGIDLEEIINNDEMLKKYRNKLVLFNSNTQLDISSTEIRNRFMNGQDYKELMNEGPYKILSKFHPSDFPYPNPMQIIEATIKYDGRFAGNTSRGLVYKENTKLFKNWSKTFFNGKKEDLVNNTKVYRQEFKVESKNNFKTKFDCVNEDCVDVAYSLINKGYNPGILNLASNVSPCGGYGPTGVLAQEESLCYSSNLSQSLLQFHPNPRVKIFKDADIKSVPNVYPMDINFGGVYSPNVCFFRNNIEKFYSIREDIFNCGVISVASLKNNGCDQNKYFKEDGYLNDTGLEIEKNKIRTILRIGLDNHHDSLVLGAFGCGAYNLKSDDISSLFNEIFSEDEFKDKFKTIVFAIYEGNGSKRRIVGRSGKFKPFYDTFCK